MSAQPIARMTCPHCGDDTVVLMGYVNLCSYCCGKINLRPEVTGIPRRKPPFPGDMRDCEANHSLVTPKPIVERRTKEA